MIILDCHIYVRINNEYIINIYTKSTLDLLYKIINNIVVIYILYIYSSVIMTELNNIESKQLTNQPSKYSKFLDSTKKAVRDALVKTWIAASTMTPMATTTTTTVIPASVNTITAIAPTASTAISTISLWAAAGLLTACSWWGEDGPDVPIDTKDTVAPTINVSKSEVDITWWKEIKISGNQLYIGDNLVASRSDNKTQNCNVILSLNWKSITSWSTISEEWTLNIKVSDAAGNSKNVDIKLSIESDVSWLDNLKNLNMQVDQEINLLNWVTFGNWAELIKTEIELDGQKTEIADPNHYTPAYPWTCSIILTVKGKDGKVTEYKVDNLTIKALEYNEASINEANMINEKYPWYNNLQQSTKDFIYPHLMASYAACNWSKLDNRVHIIHGETADTDDIENIWISSYSGDTSNHAYEGYYRIRALSPDAPIKWCNDYWENLEKYINQHSDKVFFVSCANDTWWGSSWEQMNNNPDTHTLRRILEKKNVIFIGANGNRLATSWKNRNESIKNWTKYKSASINSKLKNKITVVWYDSQWTKNYFSSYGDWSLNSAMPVWFEKDKWNIVMPMIPLIWSDNREDSRLTSSFPTAVTSGVVWNAISIIMASHPWITAEDAMTIIANNYLREETFQYKDETTNWGLKDWWKRYFIEMQNLLNNELLQSDKIENLQFNSDNIQLPSGQWICYTGVGIQFEFEWKKYMTTDTNQSILNQALKSWNIKWYWNRDTFKKCGGKDNAKINAYVVDREWKRIPDLHLNITKSIN